MASVDIEKRKNGIYYTPSSLATRLVEPLLMDCRPASVLDPACGSGSLLSAALKRLRKEHGRLKPKIYGCDIAPDYDELQQLQPEQIWKSDFLSQKFNQSFDLVLMNPPYVRHHAIPYELKEAYNESVKNVCALPKVADLWAYFLVKSVELLNDGGTLAAILPWSFLQADYARVLRAWLADRFAAIEVKAISTQQFEDAEERIALVWLRFKGRSAQTIAIRNVTDPSKDGTTHNLSWAEWLRSRIVTTNLGSVDGALSLLLDKGFVPFRDIADIRIGTVTGADSFFIAERQFAIGLGLRESDFHPIVRTLKNLRDLHLNGNCPDQVLMHFSAVHHTPQIADYVKLGEIDGLHRRAHCTRRHPWYIIPKLAPPDAFFPYRSAHTPYLILNTRGSLCTNSVHAIKWHKLTRSQIEWVQVSLLSVQGQLSIEAYGKTYGSGVLKIEPTALGNALVMTGSGRVPKTIYKSINDYLKMNEREKAVSKATEVIMSYCGIDSEAMNRCSSMLRELQQRRLFSSTVPV